MISRTHLAHWRKHQAPWAQPGLVEHDRLYVISPKVIFAATAMKVGVQRFFLVEHISLMILAAVLMTIGYSTTKKQINTPYGGKKLLFYYLIALFLILLAIPWPFRGFGTAWF